MVSSREYVRVKARTLSRENDSLRKPVAAVTAVLSFVIGSFALNCVLLLIFWKRRME